MDDIFPVAIKKLHAFYFGATEDKDTIYHQLRDNRVVPAV